MKKLLAFSVCAAVLFSLAGCQKKFEEPVDDSIQDAPAYVAGIYNQMNDLAKKHNLSFRAYHYNEITSPEFGIMRARLERAISRGTLLSILEGFGTWLSGQCRL